MNYQELVDKCKEQYNNKDLEGACKTWSMIYDLLDEKLGKFDEKDDKNRFGVYKEFNSYMEQFSNNEVYDITDYGKQKAYKQMELERTYGILDKSINLYELTKREEMKSLMDFMNFYEWCILESETEKGLYNIYDLQTNEVVDYNEENKGNKTLNETILRLVDKALDYELNETEYETDEEYNKRVEEDYIQDLLVIQEDYLQERIDELEKQIEYEDKRLDCCAYGKSDLYYLEGLKYELEELYKREYEE